MSAQWLVLVRRSVTRTPPYPSPPLAVASAFISFIGPFTKAFRDTLVNDTWIPFIETAADGESIPMTVPFDPLQVLTTEAEIAGWNAQGLPADPVSTENATIVCRSTRYPLMIDPQLQGIAWVKKLEGGDNDRCRSPG